MATNLVSIVMQFLTPDMIAKIASSLGLDRSATQKAVGGAVPALLSSLVDLVSTPSGARQLTNALAEPQAGSLESIKSLIVGSDQKTIAETGSKHAVWSPRRRSDRHHGANDWQVRRNWRGLQQVDGRHAWTGDPRRFGSTAAQRGPRCGRAGIASRLAKGPDRRGDPVRLGRSVERRRAYRQSSRERAQRSRGSLGRRKPNCRRLRTYNCRRQSSNLRNSQRGIVAVALLVGRSGDIRWSCLVCLRASGQRHGRPVAASGRSGADGDRGYGANGSDDWRGESGEPGQLIHRHSEVCASRHHGCRLGSSGPAQASRGNSPIE